MTDESMSKVSSWWRTSIIDIHPGIIRVRGYLIEDLIGRIGFPEMIWLMLRGELPDKTQADLLAAALVAGVDHGPHAPSIATARMAVTCGVGLNNAVASGVNALGDVHGGAGQQCMEIYGRIIALAKARQLSLQKAVDLVLCEEVVEHGRYVPGFGHRFHATDPRAVRLLTLTDQAVQSGAINGLVAAVGREVEHWLEGHKGRRLPMNIDGVTAVIFAELGFPSELCRGLFVLSRSVGILSHAWEQRGQGQRIKGPLPPSIPYRYEGPVPRTLEGESGV